MTENALNNAGATAPVDSIVSTPDTSVAVPVKQPEPETKPETVEIEANVTEQAEHEDAAPSTEPESEETPKKKKGGFQSRIDKLTQEKYEILAEKQRYEERVRQLEQASKPRVSEKEPVLEQYSTVEDFIKDHKAWAKAEAEKELIARIQQENTQRERIKKAAAFQVREDEARTKYADYNRVVAQLGPIVQQIEPLREYILESDMGPEVAYHLASNPTFLNSLLQMNGLQALRELTRLETRLSQSPPQKSQTKAPEPIKPVGSSEKAPFNPDNASYEEYKRKRNEEERKRKAK